MEEKKQKKGCLGKIFPFIILLCLLSMCSGGEDDLPEESTTAVEIEAKEEKKTQKQVFVEELTSNKNVKKKAAKKAFTILKEKMGFKKIEVTNKQEENTTFEVSADSYSLRMVVSDKVYRIWCGDYNLYEDGKVKYKKKDLDDRTISENQSAYYVIAQEIVSSFLKAPSTADFAPMYETAMQRNKKLVAVKGYVDSQNSFGAMIRSEYLVEFKVIDIDSFNYELIYINIDGEESGEFKKLN